MKKGKEQRDNRKRIKELEERIKKLEEEKIEEKEESTVSKVLGGIIPGFGKFIGSISKSSPELQKKLEETDEEIKRRLASGWSSEPKISYGYSIRTLGGGKITKTWEATPKKEKYINEMKIVQEVPKVEEKDIKIDIIGKKLIIKIEKEKYKKEIDLPFYVSEKKIKYKNGLLYIELKRR